MARAMNRGNRQMNLRAIELLDAGPDAHVLDLGFGGGTAVAELLDRGARVTAVDPAADMVTALRERHADAIANGSLDVHEGGVEALPLAGESLDGALTVNTVYFWPRLERGLAELARVLRPGAMLVLAIRDGSVMGNVSEEIFTLRTPAAIRDATEAAGFEARIETREDRKVHWITGRRTA